MELRQNTLLHNGEYRIIRTLGKDGFGITYLASQISLDRKVVVKEFFIDEYCERDTDTSRVSLGTSGSHDMVLSLLEKFIKDARNIASLDHPSIVRVIDVFEENGTAYYVMEFHSSGSLGAFVGGKEKMSEEDAVRYIR